MVCTPYSWYMGDYRGGTIGLVKGDTRSLDCSLYALLSSPPVEFNGEPELLYGSVSSTVADSVPNELSHKERLITWQKRCG